FSSRAVHQVSLVESISVGGSEGSLVGSGGGWAGSDPNFHGEHPRQADVTDENPRFDGEHLRFDLLQRERIHGDGLRTSKESAHDSICYGREQTHGYGKRTSTASKSVLKKNLHRQPPYSALHLISQVSGNQDAIGSGVQVMF
ncbi:unnamed protein product, partial [Urochloa humidicola]